MVKKELKKEVAQISVKRNIENLKREQKGFKENLKFHEDLLKKLYADKELLIKRYDLMESKFKIINPIWEYEKDPEFTKMLKTEFGAKREQDLKLFDQNEEQIKTVIERQKDALDSVTKELKRLEKKNAE